MADTDDTFNIAGGDWVAPLQYLPTPSPFDLWRLKLMPTGEIGREPLYQAELDRLLAEIADLKVRHAKLEAASG